MDKIDQFIADIKETIFILEIVFFGFILFFCIIHFGVGIDTRSSVKPALIIGCIWGLVAWVSQFLPDDFARRDLLEMWKKRKKNNTRRFMSKRDIIKPHGKSEYAVRDKDGKFVDITNIGKSIAEDARTKSKKTVKPGHGHEGDLKRK